MKCDNKEFKKALYDDFMEKIAELKEQNDLVSARDIANTPTVEAIPIEWIEKWLENIKNNQRYLNDYCQIPGEIKRVAKGDRLSIRIPCVSDMLEDWRKENET